MIILIDSGATHNFITEAVAKRCGLVCESTENYLVVMGNGDKVGSARKYMRVTLNIQGLDICGDFLSMELGSLDIILGV